MTRDPRPAAVLTSKSPGRRGRAARSGAGGARLRPEPDGRIRADLSLVLGDVRTGKVLWRSLALARGKSPDEALNAALAAVLPRDP